MALWLEMMPLRLLCTFQDMSALGFLQSCWIGHFGSFVDVVGAKSRHSPKVVPLGSEQVMC